MAGGRVAAAATPSRTRATSGCILTLLKQELENLISVAFKDKDASLTTNKCLEKLALLVGEQRVEEHREYIRAEVERIMQSKREAAQKKAEEEASSAVADEAAEAHAAMDTDPEAGEKADDAVVPSEATHKASDEASAAAAAAQHHAAADATPLAHSGPQFTRCTSTKVRILTHAMRLRQPPSPAPPLPAPPRPVKPLS